MLHLDAFDIHMQGHLEPFQFAAERWLMTTDDGLHIQTPPAKFCLLLHSLLLLAAVRMLCKPIVKYSMYSRLCTS